METRTTRSSRKEKNLSIPATVRIGVTGHRKLANKELISGSVKRVLIRLDKMLSHTSHKFIVVSALAEGADRLVASEVLDWSVAGEANKPELEIVLPLPEEDYLQDFETRESKHEFEALFDRAKSVKTIENVEPRTAAYEQAGRNVVENCDVLVAIWDGKPAAGRGGTAEIVEYAREVGRSIFWLNSENGEIKEERHEDHTLEALEYLDAYNGERLNNLKHNSKSSQIRRLG